MGEAAAVSALGLTVFLVLRRPTIARRIVVGPALAAACGVLVMLLAGHVTPGDVGESAGILWRPLLAITAIMVIASSAQHLGVLDRVSDQVLSRARGSARRLFTMVFVLSAAAAASLNNDAAILLITPLVVVLVRRLYPGDGAAYLPFVFAVFMAAGVAPIATSNPMNLIVADFAGLDFNSYAVRMIPVAVAGWVVTWLCLRIIFRGTLRRLDAVPAEPLHVGSGHGTALHGSHRHSGAAHPGRKTARLEAGRSTAWARAEVHGLLLVLAVLSAYPVLSSFGVDVWIASVIGAGLALVLCHHHRAVRPDTLLRQGVSWEILAFLVGVFTIAIGLRNAGAVDWLAGLYQEAGVGLVGTVSAVGSALINNHSMALTNLMAIEGTGAGAETMYLAALVGGDLGPRLLPMGSLAGLLWLATLKRMHVDLPITTFVKVGVIVTAPTLLVSLLVLAASG